MKPKDKDSDPARKAKPDPRKKQFIVLGGLTALLAVVLVVQFGGSGPDRTASAATAPVATAPVESVAEADAAAPESAAPAAETVDHNPVLAEPFEGNLTRSPFASFWSTATGATQTAAPDVPPPAVRLEATMPGESRPLAVIDGRLHFVGDDVQGWKLSEIRPRAIVLSSPARAQFVVEMPVLVGRLDLPAGTLPAAVAVPPAADG